MKKLLVAALTTLLTTAICATVPTRYYVGSTEVSESFWNQIPDSLRGFAGEFDYDTCIVKVRELPLTHYIDSVSTEGEYVLRERTAESVAELERLYSIARKKYAEEFLSHTSADTAPQLTLTKYNDGQTVENFIIDGECYLLSFWATWCGGCLLELQPEHLPAVIEEFSSDTSFHFIPICIDATFDDLKEWFSNQANNKWLYLADITYIDPKREANGRFGVPAHLPLNFVIGKDGRILYHYYGAINTEQELSELYEAIKSGL